MNLAAFCTVKNLPAEANSCFGNVHLLALCYCTDITVYGFDGIIEKFVNEIQELSTIGLKSVFPILGERTVYASLCQVTCDNLALNSLLGFIECFSASYYCTICYTTSDEMQTKFREEQFELRTVGAYNNDLVNLTDAKKKGKLHYSGIKRACKLNDINPFVASAPLQGAPSFMRFFKLSRVKMGYTYIRSCSAIGWL